MGPVSPPAWAAKSLPPPPPPPEWRAPSRLVRPGMDRSSARRGSAIHKLFQILPDLPPAVRNIIARRLLTRRGFFAGEAEEIIGSVLALIADREFAPFFAASSLAEVPFAVKLDGLAGPISGQIDRLVVAEQEVFILDFKTDRQPPLTVASVSHAYVAQLAAYRASLAEIFPGRLIRAALLWTEVPLLMELPAAMLEQAFSAYHNPVRRA